MIDISESAAFLADPNFSGFIDPATTGECVLRSQRLYQQYSTLHPTRDYDRPTDIGGIQQRLLRTMNVQGGFGVFEDNRSKGVLRRSLLWHRAIGTNSLGRIAFPPDCEKVPSWSWMAVSSGIDYFVPAFDCFDWHDIQSPWSRANNVAGDSTLIAIAHALQQHGHGDDDSLIIRDRPAESEHNSTIAVVSGTEKGDESLAKKRHYVLVILPSQTVDAQGWNLFERVGAGYLTGHCLVGDPKAVHIT
jgi:hypothetical protein